MRRHTSRGNGDLDLTYIERVCADIALALRDKAGFTAIVVRSTVAGTVVIGNRDRYFCEVVGRLKHGAARGRPCADRRERRVQWHLLVTA